MEVWDIRYGTEPLGTYPRKGQTNQRLGFDVDPTGAYIAIGDEVSPLSCWARRVLTIIQEGTVSIYSTAWDEGQPIPMHTIQVAKGKRSPCLDDRADSKQTQLAPSPFIRRSHDCSRALVPDHSLRTTQRVKRRR